jgi:hypothetical protein
MQHFSSLKDESNVEENADSASGEGSSFGPRTTAPGSTVARSVDENLPSRRDTCDQDSGNELRKTFKPVPFRCWDCADEHVVFDSELELSRHTQEVHEKKSGSGDERGMGPSSFPRASSSAFVQVVRSNDASAALTMPVSSDSDHKQSKEGSTGFRRFETSLNDANNQPKTTTDNEHSFKPDHERFFKPDNRHFFEPDHEHSFESDAMQFKSRGSQRNRSNRSNNHRRPYPNRRPDHIIRQPDSSFLPRGLIPAAPGIVFPQPQQPREDSLQGVYTRYSRSSSD